MSLATRLYAALFLSGGAALVYQIVWVRQLTLVLGSTYEAVATVLAVFMAGLGLGSLLAARWADGLAGKRLPWLFALLEAGTAGFALAFPLIMSGLTPAFRIVAEAPAWLGLARVGAAAVALCVPTTLMGATLPVLAAHRERSGSAGTALGSSAGALYAANTAGAVVGSLAAGVLLLELVGVRATTFIAVAANLAAAAVVLATVRNEPTGERRLDAPASSDGSRLVLAVAFLSGLGALASEVAWTRSLILIIGPTSYGFSFVISAVILGLALGSVVGRRLRSGLFTVQLAAAAGCLVVIALVPRLVIPMGGLVHDYADEMGTLLLIELAGILLLLIVPSFCFGATFPLVVSAVGGAPARATGLTLGWNTAGAVVGSLLAGFVALPLASAEVTLLVAVLAHLVAAVLVFPRRRPLALGAPALVLASFLIVSDWDPEILTGGLYKYAPYLERAEFLDFLLRGELVFHEEDRAATVSVKRIGSRVSLAVDGKVDATNTEDLLTQRLLAHVPLLLHDAPRGVLVIGLGSGVTAGSALTHPIERLDAVEISAGVVAAQEYFTDVNHRAMDDPRFHLDVQDGRNHLLLSERNYDVIISEPSNPWMAGVSGLFTRELFATAKERLTPSGLFCQWAHLYNLPEEDLKTLVGTFTDVFEETALFALSESDVLLVGAKSTFYVASPAAVQARMTVAGVAEDLASVGILGLAGLSSLYAVSTPALAEWAKGAVRHTDDRPVLEFRAPRAMHRDTSRSNLATLGELRSVADVRIRALQVPATAEDLRARAEALLIAESYQWAFEIFSHALELDPRSLPAHRGLVHAAVAGARAEAAEERFVALAASAAPVEARIALAMLHREYGRLDEAIRFLADALRLEPARRDALVLAAEVAGERGELDAMVNLARTILARDPGDAEAAALLAEATLRRGNSRLAAEQSAAIVVRRPEVARAQKVLAIALAETGDPMGARRAFEALLELEPDVVAHLNNYASFELRAEHTSKALELFERAVDLSPRNVVGYEGLRDTAARLGDRKRRERAESMLAFLGSAP